MSVRECDFEGDRFFIFSTWGDPREWYDVEYIIKCIEDRSKRTIIAYRGGITTAATTKALSQMLEALGKHVTVTIFIQDTLLLNIIKEQDQESQKIIRSLWPSEGKAIIKRRSELRGYIFKYIGKINSYDVVVLPGIASFRSGGYLYIWRGDECYEYIRGGMLTHALKKLAQAPEETIGVIVDTSHGVNYFAIALKDVIPLACALYVVKRALSNAERTQLHLYHYNVQPIIASMQKNGISTALEIISFGEIGFQRAKQESFGPYFEIIREHIESIFSRRAFENVIDYLKGRVPWLDESQKNSWEVIAASTLLFVRGILPWALRIAKDLRFRFDDILNKFDEKLNEVEIKFKTSKSRPEIGVERTATYDWRSGGAPNAEAVTLALLAAILKEGADSALSQCPEGEAKEVDEVEEVIGKCKVQNEDAREKALQLLDKLKEGCVRVPASRLSELAGVIYPKPFSVIVQAEIDEQFKKYFEVPCKESCCNENVKILPENDIVVKSGDFEVYLPYYMDKPAQERHFYAHAGLVRGTIFAVVRRRNEYVLLLGPYEPVLRALREWHGK
ncbi:MAG: hypothetical protein LM590_14525 [Thermofilum sp.]|nr:hypothetical protein [Thermofilum sp.]MCC6065148.1 hypothetical protein [Thermofilum sp.]